MNSFYDRIHQQATGLLEGETDLIANMANIAALLWLELPAINWAGFYLRQGNELVLGPFHGQPACTRIPMGAGVCGTAAAKRETVIVADVQEFPGHITCDPRTNAEIVVPLTQGGALTGVLDIDSPVFNRFNRDDRTGLEALVQLLVPGNLPDWGQ